MSTNRPSKTLLFFVMVFFLSIPTLTAGEPETLLGLDFNYHKQEITIKVVSHGCTQKADFQFIVKNNSLTVERVKEDRCKALGEPASFTYSFKEAGLDSNTAYTITNKFTANPFLAGIRKKVKK